MFPQEIKKNKRPNRDVCLCVCVGYKSIGGQKKIWKCENMETE